MEISGAKQIYAKTGFNFSGLDELFGKVSADVPDGYIIATSGASTRYLFIIGGELYTTAIAEAGKRGCAPVKDFFTWFADVGTADVKVYMADKKLLLCMLVSVSHNPAQSFTTDIVNLEDAVKMIEKASKDIVISLKSDKERGFAIFINGKAVYVFLPSSGSGEEGSPLDRLLLYSYNMPPDKYLSVELYDDTKVVPAADSAPFAPGGVKEYAGAAPEAAVPDASHDAVAPGAVPLTGAYVEVFEQGAKKARFPISEELVIGREAGCDIALSESGVSRRHAVIRTDLSGFVTIEDAGSANGILFEGEKISKKEINDNDEITIRDYTLRFHVPRAEDEAVIEPEPASQEPDLASQTIYAEPIPDEGEGEAAPSEARVEFEDGTAFKLASITTIGKDEDSDIKIQGMLAGKRHASIIRGKGIYKLIKKGGLSPVKVNNEKIDDHTLSDGDIIEVAGKKMTYRT